jgi:predicted nucleic acid-binding Zn ribbon protein
VRRVAPRPLASALEQAAIAAAPATTLARLQRSWPAVAGEMVARESAPVAERDGVVTVACQSAVWAHELELMSRDLVARLNDALEAHGSTRAVRDIRLVTRSSGTDL